MLENSINTQNRPLVFQVFYIVKGVIFLKKSFWLFFLILLVSISCGCAQDNSNNKTPEPYKPILSIYNDAIDGYFNGTFEADYNKGKFLYPNETMSDRWDFMMVELFHGIKNVDRNYFDYVLKDINGDNVLELVLMRKDDTVLAILTIINGEAVLLDAYWSRYKGAILSSGEIYTYGSGGAYSFDYSILEINMERQILEVKKQFGMDEGAYYELVDGKRKTIDKVTFDKIKEQLEWGKVVLGDKGAGNTEG